MCTVCSSYARKFLSGGVSGSRRNPPAYAPGLVFLYFPSSPQPLCCSCDQIIDQFGDHLLGCGHDPLRINHLNALRDTIWHALLVDNKAAVREQHCGVGSNRPGDYSTQILCWACLPILMFPFITHYNLSSCLGQQCKQEQLVRQMKWRRMRGMSWSYSLWVICFIY